MTVGSSKAFRLFLILLAAAAAIRLTRVAIGDGGDLHVYWFAAQTWAHGGSPYMASAGERGFVFKYPPWTIPLFFPLRFFSFELMRWLWCAMEFVCVGLCARWLFRQGARLGAIACAAALLWWIWMGHFSAGQFTLPMLTVALLGFGESPEVEGFVAYFLSAKIFSVIALLGATNLRRPRFWLRAAGLGLFGLSLVYFTLPHPDGVYAFFMKLFGEFRAAAASGGADLGAKIVRGQGNHGFPALVLRHLDPDGQRLNLDLLVSVLIAAALSMLWWKGSHCLRPAERWAGWLAISVVAHPLAWHHSFVMLFPLITFSISAALDSGKKSLVTLALLGGCCIGIAVPQVMGHDLVTPFELLGVKSWGAVIVAITLILSRREALRVS